ncbi:MAG: SdrD B-like domain-containing protein [Gulosibacter sp.]|uniref:SdrD B-like domain-containing protein n=1 Tax=Gulosibacter sp. TaxID=2817531 RepID=UPI003F93AEE5
MAALLAFALAMTLAIVGFAPAAKAASESVELAEGVTVTMNYDTSGELAGQPVMQEGAKASFQIRYDSSVEPGSSVSFLVPAQFTLADLPSGNTAVENVVHDTETNVVTLTFADPWPEDVFEGVLGFESTLVISESSGIETLEWGLVGDTNKFQLFLLKQGENPVTITDGESKRKVSDNFGEIFDITDNAFVVKEGAPTPTVQFAIAVNSADARVDAVITDTLSTGLAFVQNSFKLRTTTYDENGLNPTTTTYDENGLNPTTTTVDVSASDITFDGQTFTYTHTFPASSQAELIYDTEVTNLAEVAAELTEQYQTSSGNDRAIYRFNNSAKIDDGSELTASAEFNYGLPGIGVGETFGKSTSWHNTFVEFDGDGSLQEPKELEVTWTLTANLDQFDGSHPRKTLTDNLVMADPSAAGLSWVLPTGEALAGTENGEDHSFTWADFDGTRDEFQADAYVNHWTVTDDNVVLINFGKDTTNNYTVQLVSAVTDAANMWDGTVYGFADGIAKAANNKATFFWSESQERTVDAWINIVDRDGHGDEPWNSDQFFNKTAAQDSVKLNPGDTADLRYTLELKAGPVSGLGHEVDLATATLVDYVDHSVFDVNSETLPAIQEKSTVSYNNAALDAADYEISLDEDNNILISLTEAGADKVAGIDEGKGTLKADLVLTTKPLQDKQVVEITNQAGVLGSEKETIYVSSSSSSATSFGDEAQITKHVRDQQDQAWVTNLRADVNEDGSLADDTFVYRIQYIAHGSFGNLSITPVIDQLPEGIEFLGFLNEANVDDEENLVDPGTVQDLGNNLVASYDADQGPSGTVTIQSKENANYPVGQTTHVNLLVKLTDFDEDTPVVNQIRNVGATITPTNGYPLSVQKLDSSDDNKVISDSNARFQVLDAAGDVVVDNAFIQDGYLRVMDGDKVKGLIVDEPGTYTVKEITPPAGYALTDEVLTFEVVTDEVPEGQVLYNSPETFAVGDYTWIDENNDGIQDEDEPILSGVSVSITDADGNPVTDFNGNEVASTTTDANGFYVFDNLVAGDYKITFTLTEEQQATYGFTGQNKGNDESNDSDAHPATGETAVFTLNKDNANLDTEYTNDSGVEIQATNGIDPTWDAGVVNKSYAVGDYTWIDSDRDGIQDATEEVLPGVTVNLLDGNGEQIATTKTDDNGFYVFDNLPEGMYQLEFILTEEQAAKYNFTDPNKGTDGAINSDANPATGITQQFNLNDNNVHLTTEYTNASGTVVEATRGIDPTWDAGVVEKSYAVGDYTWIDSDRDGIQDATEAVLPGVTVELTDAEGNPVKDIFGKDVAPTETDEEGYYLFDNLPAGDYQIKFTLTEEQSEIYRFTTQNTGDDESTNDSDANPTTGVTATFTLDSSNPHLDSEYHGVQATEGIDPTWDAGVIGKTYAVGDYTWIDTNRDGIQDEGEDVLPGVKVELLDSEGTVLEETVTDENGFYLFDERAAGEYQLRFTLTEDQAATYKFTTQNTGATGTDSDVDPETGLTVPFTLNDSNSQLTTDYENASGTVVTATEGIDPTWDAGVIVKTYAIGDFTWIDSNRDGIQDEGEPVLPGVTVNLYDADGEEIATTTTDENGFYLFDELPGGEYQLEFVLTEEQSVKYIFTNADAGDSDALDSDANTETGRTILITLDDSNAALTTDYTNASDAAVKATEGIDPTWDAGVIERSYAIGDYTWIDENRDGVQDEDEPVLPGVTVEITDPSGNPVKDVYGNEVPSTTTDENGKYIFDNLPAGDYKIKFILPEEIANEYVFTPRNQGDDPATDSDANPTGDTTTITLGETNESITPDYDGEFEATEGVDPTWEAGVVKKSYAVGDYTWIDENRDGVQGEDEPVLPGVIVTITDASGKPVVDVYGNEVPSTVTDENGFYVFDNLPKGDYIITFEIPEEFAGTHVFSPTGNGGADDSDADRVTGKTITISLNDSNEYLSTDYSNASETVISATQGIDPTWDAGIVTKTYAIGDFTWIDENKDGLQDEGEPVLPGVRVELLDADGEVIAETVTNENGYYLFDELAAGEYQIRFTLTDEQAEIYEFTSQNSGETGNDSDADSAGLTVKIVLDDSNAFLTQEYSIADVLATQGIDPTWDAGVIVKPGETMPPVPTPTDGPDNGANGGSDAGSNGGADKGADGSSDKGADGSGDGDDLASTGAQFLPLAIVALVLALAGLGITLAVRRRNQQA